VGTNRICRKPFAHVVFSSFKHHNVELYSFQVVPQNIRVCRKFFATIDIGRISFASDTKALETVETNCP
jgi:hypothetical protein